MCVFWAILWLTIIDLTMFWATGIVVLTEWSLVLFYVVFIYDGRACRKILIVFVLQAATLDRDFYLFGFLGWTVTKLFRKVSQRQARYIRWSPRLNFIIYPRAELGRRGGAVRPVLDRFLNDTILLRNWVVFLGFGTTVLCDRVSTAPSRRTKLLFISFLKRR